MANVYYLAVTLVALVAAAPIDYLGRPVSTVEIQSGIIVVGIIWQCLLGAYLAELVVFSILPRVTVRRGLISLHVTGKEAPRLSYVRACAVGLALLAFPAAVIGAGASYEEFTSGMSIGWGVTLYLMSVGALPLIYACGWSAWRRMLAVAPVIIAGVSLSYATSVRSLLALPLLTIVACVTLGSGEKRRLGKRDVTYISIVIIAVIFYCAISFKRGVVALLPELVPASLFLFHVDTELVSDGAIGDNPAVRIIGGIASYPLDRILGWKAELSDPASYIGAQTMGPWAVEWAHFPSTWFLDLFLSSRLTIVFEAFLVVVVLGVAAQALRARSVITMPFWPLFFWVQLMTVRGSLWTGATSVSAAMTYLMFAILVARFSILIAPWKRVP